MSDSLALSLIFSITFYHFFKCADKSAHIVYILPYASIALLHQCWIINLNVSLVSDNLSHSKAHVIPSVVWGVGSWGVRDYGLWGSFLSGLNTINYIERTSRNVNVGWFLDFSRPIRFRTVYPEWLLWVVRLWGSNNGFPLVEVNARMLITFQ